MDEKLKQRLVGAAVIISLAVIFLPMMLDGGRHAELDKLSIEIPSIPENEFSSSIEVFQPKPPEIDNEIRRYLPKAQETQRFDEIEQEGSKPVLTSELEDIIKPIKPADRIVSKKGEIIKDSTANAPDQLAKPVQDKSPSRPALPKTEKPQQPAQSPIASVSAWVIQVGSFDSRKNAITLRDKIRKHGFTAFVESFQHEKKSSHRVRVGPETDRNRIESIQKKLKKKLLLNGIVVSYP